MLTGEEAERKVSGDGPGPRGGDITRLLEAVNAGEREAWEELLPAVYAELRKVAGGLMKAERAGHTLQPTALVHEAYVKLAGQEKAGWDGRRHFFAAAAGAMRRLLVDHARRRDADKRGGDWARVSLAAAGSAPGAAVDVDALALHEALELLAERSPRQARVVELRYFGGLTLEEAAEHLEITPRQAKGDWLVARTWLYKRLSLQPPPEAGA